MTYQAPEPPRPGTVYGGGGADIREPKKSGLHPAVLILAALSVIIVVAAVGYLTLRPTPDGGTTQAAAGPGAPSSAASAPAAPASAEQAPASAAPVKLAAGAWLVSPFDDPTTHLSVDGDFAAMSSGQATVLTVIAGLADESCFTFHTKDNRYLRHFDYRLRFDKADDSDLFRHDATWCAVPDLPEGTIQLRSKNYPEYLMHRRGTELYIDKPDDTDTFLEESSFTVR